MGKDFPIKAGFYGGTAGHRTLGPRIFGYYSLSAASLAFERLTEADRKAARVARTGCHRR
jgi:hypothetical protein